MLLVVGNAATADGLVRALEVPESHDVGHLAAVAGDADFWMPGGSAATVAIAASRYTDVRLGHPLPANAVSPSGRALRKALLAAGVDTRYCPELDHDVRALVVEVPDQHRRLMWSEPGAPFAPDVAALLDGVEHVVFAPRWGSWSAAVLEGAVQAGLPCSIIGEIPPVAYRWEFAIADHRQMTDGQSVSAQYAVTTAGSRGAFVRGAGTDIRVDAVSTVVVDTTGAGDTFGGTLIAAFLRGDPLAQAGAMAAKAAADQCTRWGAIPSKDAEQKGS